jgi:hypothetical protein
VIYCARHDDMHAITSGEVGVEDVAAAVDKLAANGKWYVATSLTPSHDRTVTRPSPDLRKPASMASSSNRANPETRTFGQLLIDLEEDRAARAVVFGLLREMSWHAFCRPSATRHPHMGTTAGGVGGHLGMSVKVGLSEH